VPYCTGGKFLWLSHANFQFLKLGHARGQHGISSQALVGISTMVAKSKNPMVATTAGAIAGGIETLTIWPMEMIKTNLQLGTMRAQYTGMLGGFRYHVQTDGVGSLYRGLAPVLVGSIPKAGIRFGAFDYIKRRLADENGTTSAVRNLAAGMMAGAIEATLTTTPVRVNGQQ
jgi:solute carrier family 25 citrate transporter 1